jgi:ferredoxin
LDESKDQERGKSFQDNLRKKEITMKATITKECMGDRNCNKLCAEVFEYDEDQLLSIVKYDVIPKHLEAIVQRAADECGANAIIIEE